MGRLQVRPVPPSPPLASSAPVLCNAYYVNHGASIPLAWGEYSAAADRRRQLDGYRAAWRSALAPLARAAAWHGAWHGMAWRPCTSRSGPVPLYPPRTRSTISPRKLIATFPAPDEHVHTLYDNWETAVARFPHVSLQRASVLFDSRPRMWWWRSSSMQGALR